GIGPVIRRWERLLLPLQHTRVPPFYVLRRSVSPNRTVWPCAADGNLNTELRTSRSRRKARRVGPVHAETQWSQVCLLRLGDRSTARMCRSRRNRRRDAGVGILLLRDPDVYGCNAFASIQPSLTSAL